ncbi:DNA starvation/stationary phase protection protein [Niallia sp. XMNu-256]|uniref:Dps family protein n=1 Tax=Niallia sp. XMNu-256 TaxID=3082444 RepID=UPI0030CEE368
MNQELIGAVNKQVANWMVLYTKLHHFHWYVKGNHFFTLHEKFEELYDEANEHIDELAERILTISGNPVSTLKECLEISSIKEAKGNESEEDMVRETITDFQTIIGECQSAMELAEKANDEGTSDMLLGVIGGLQKHVWMLNAYLG